MKDDMRNFKDSLPDPKEVQEILSSTRRIHNKVVGIRDSIQRNEPPPVESDRDSKRFSVNTDSPKKVNLK